MSENRGGVREGSGRKSIYNEPTKTVRVPLSRVVAIKEFLANTKKRELNDVSSIMRIDPNTRMRIPLATEKISAGFPSPAQDYVEKTLDMNEHLLTSSPT